MHIFYFIKENKPELDFIIEYFTDLDVPITTRTRENTNISIDTSSTKLSSATTTKMTMTSTTTSQITTKTILETTIKEIIPQMKTQKVPEKTATTSENQITSKTKQPVTKYPTSGISCHNKFGLPENYDPTAIEFFIQRDLNNRLLYQTGSYIIFKCLKGFQVIHLTYILEVKP